MDREIGDRLYEDKNGEVFEEQFLWDIFIEWVMDGVYEDYSEKSFQKYLKDEGMAIAWWI